MQGPGPRMGINNCFVRWGGGGKVELHKVKIIALVVNYELRKDEGED